jgi:hypothetical protein
VVDTVSLKIIFFVGVPIGEQFILQPFIYLISNLFTSWLFSSLFIERLILRKVGGFL